MYTDDDEIGRAVAADLEECWQGDGWYRICFTDGMGSYPATWYGTEADLADDLRGAICVPRVEPAPDPNRRRTHAF